MLAEQTELILSPYTELYNISGTPDPQAPHLEGKHRFFFHSQ